MFKIGDLVRPNINMLTGMRKDVLNSTLFEITSISSSLIEDRQFINVFCHYSISTDWHQEEWLVFYSDDLVKL